MNQQIEIHRDALKDAVCLCSGDEMDLSLLNESLRLTPWERMLANDDALNFAESLRTAMNNRDAKSQ